MQTLSKMVQSAYIGILMVSVIFLLVVGAVKESVVGLFTKESAKKSISDEQLEISQSYK